MTTVVVEIPKRQMRDKDEDRPVVKVDKLRCDHRRGGVRYFYTVSGLKIHCRSQWVYLIKKTRNPNFKGLVPKELGRTLL